MPFTPELHKLVKKALKENVEVISSLRGQRNSKLSFNMATGKFSTEINGFFGRKKSPDDAPPDILNQRKEDGIDSATNQNRFEYPLLITFYELRKLDLNIKNKKKAKEGNPYNERLKNNVTPDKAFEDVCAALVYLRDYTYTGLLKGNQRNAITDILSKAKKLQESTTQPQLDCRLAGWIPFVIPESIKILVYKSFRLIQDGLGGSVKVIHGEATKQEISPVDLLGSIIYRDVYSSGGASVKRDEAKEKTYAQDIKTKIDGKGIGTVLQDTDTSNKNNLALEILKITAKLENFIDGTALNKLEKNAKCKSIGFCHFFCSNQWTVKNVQARVYIHLKHEENGASALAGLEKILSYLSDLSKSEVGKLILGKFKSFKICDLKMLRERTDSIVMYCGDMETAKKIADGLKEPLKDLVVASLPPGVREIFPGIGWATEPEPSFDPRFSKLAPYKAVQFSYGSHRSGLIAKGLLDAAVKPAYMLPVIDTCLKNVAFEFSDAGVEFFKPHHTGSLPPSPPPKS